MVASNVKILNKYLPVVKVNAIYIPKNKIFNPFPTNT